MPCFFLNQDVDRFWPIAADLHEGRLHKHAA